MFTWILENLGKDEYFNDFVKAIQHYKDIELVILDRQNKFELKKDPLYRKVIFNGSISRAQILKDRLEKEGCYPIIWYNQANYNCTDYYGKLASYIFNDSCAFVPVNLLKHNKWHYYNLFSAEASIFIRPDSGNKIFTGQLIDLQDFDRLINTYIENNGLGINDIVLIDRPRKIKGEWRFVCSHHTIIASTSYLYDGLLTTVPGAPLEAKQLVNEILATGFSPDKIFTIDICLNNNGKYHLLEINSFNFAGMYAADKAKIVETVIELMKQEIA